MSSHLVTYKNILFFEELAIIASTASQLAGMETHKGKAILAERDDEFVKKYL
jgi:predicted HTH domain antitoxin